jgi:OPA family glycerol-3-phosphate transporter-like MFS transporter
LNDPRTARWQTITLAVLFIGYAGYYVCRSDLSVATPLIVRDASAGITKEEIGFIVSVGTFFYAMGKISNGILVDFLGGRLLFLLGMLASVGCTLVFGVVDGLAVMTVVWAVNNFVQSAGWGALVKIASRWFPVSVQATVMGFLSMSYLIGDALVRLYLGAMIHLGVDWRGLFLISATTLWAVLLVNLFLLKGSPQEVGAEEPPADPANLFGAGGEDHRPDGLIQLLLPFLTSLTFWLVCLMNVGLTLIRQTLNVWTPLYLAEVGGFTQGSAAISSMLVPLAGGVAAFLGGRLSDRLGGRHALVALPALVLLTGSLLLMSAIPLAGEQQLILVLLGLVAFFLMAPYSFCSGVIPLQIGGKRGSSTAAGMIDAAGYLGGVLSGYGIGSVVQHYSWATAFLLLAGTACLTALVTFLYWLSQPYRSPAKDGPVP